MGRLEAEIWCFQVAHQGYLTLGAGSPVLKQVASGDRVIGICNTAYKTLDIKEPCYFQQIICYHILYLFKRVEVMDTLQIDDGNSSDLRSIVALPP